MGYKRSRNAKSGRKLVNDEVQFELIWTSRLALACRDAYVRERAAGNRERAWEALQAFELYIRHTVSLDCSADQGEILQCLDDYVRTEQADLGYYPFTQGFRNMMVVPAVLLWGLIVYGAYKMLQDAIVVVIEM